MNKRIANLLSRNYPFPSDKACSFNEINWFYRRFNISNGVAFEIMLNILKGRKSNDKILPNIG